jgi:hypothetical protein
VAGQYLLHPAVHFRGQKGHTKNKLPFDHRMQTRQQKKTWEKSLPDIKVGTPAAFPGAKN